ncbi:MAG: hypothetical protein HYY15_01190 [Candidatus Omnitrophica bacterium]|nr:hypothetical protein [Candidatus Omnitrophota bacterium]
MKILRNVAIGLVVAVGLLLLGKNAIANLAVRSGVKAVTGLDLKIRRLDVSLARTKVSVEGLQVMNPAGFTDAVMVDIPELFVDFDLPSILSGRPHLEELRLHVNELVVVKNAQGQVNLQSIKAVQASQEQAAKPAPKQSAPSFVIDTLELWVGTVVYKDYSTPTPQVREFNVNIQEQFHHVTNPQVLAGLIITRALAKTTIANLTNLNLDALQSDVAGFLTGSLDQAVDVGGRVLGTAEDAVKGTAGALKKMLGQ